MAPEAGSPAAWLRHARSDLALARAAGGPDVLRETRCFHAQQAVEKCLKAVLVRHGIAVPRTHNVKILQERLPAAVAVPDVVAAAAGLTDYAVMARYPGDYEEVTEEELRAALAAAEAVLLWAGAQLGD
jgi:HEPN domain-containing protein